jgi:flagellin FlaB
MLRKIISRIFRQQKGITGLETAIILIAFVVVAAVFAYTVLSAGLFSTQKSQEAVYSGLQETQSTMQVMGDVVGYRSTLNNNVDVGKVEFTVSLSSGGVPLDLTPEYTVLGNGHLDLTTDDANKLQIAYNDSVVTIPDCAWTVAFVGKNNSDYMLDPGEKAVITVWLQDYTSGSWVNTANGDDNPWLGVGKFLDTNHTFTLEVKPSTGATVSIERTTPAFIDPVINLH